MSRPKRVPLAPWGERWFTQACLCEQGGERWVEKRFTKPGHIVVNAAAWFWLWKSRADFAGQFRRLLPPRTSYNWPRMRMLNELHFTEFLGDHGLRVPRIFWEKSNPGWPWRTLSFEFVEGEDIYTIYRRDDFDAGVRAGRFTREAHSLGVVFGDGKPQNYIFDRRGRVCRCDLEYAAHTADHRARAGDLEMFLGFLPYYGAEETAASAAAKGLQMVVGSPWRRPALREGFVSGFLEGYGDRRVLEEVASSRVLEAMVPLIGRAEVRAVKEAVRDHLGR